MVDEAAKIYNELDALQKQRRQSELKLRSLDQQRRPLPGSGARLGPPSVDRRDRPVTGANATPIAASGEPPREGPPREGRWLHDGDQLQLPRNYGSGGWQSGRERDIAGRMDDDRNEKPKVRSAVSTVSAVGTIRSAVSKPVPVKDEDDVGDEDGEFQSRRKRKLEDAQPDLREAITRRRRDDGDDDTGLRRRKYQDDEGMGEREHDGGRDRDRVRDEDRQERPVPKVVSMHDRRDRGGWRDGGGPGRGRAGVSSRLSSVIAVGKAADKEGESKDDEETGRKPRVALSDNADVKKRNRRMFSNLLGHLQKAKKEEEELTATTTMQKRVELDQKAETKASESAAQLREHLKTQRIAERKAQLASIREIRAKQLAALHSLAVLRAETQTSLLSRYIRTAGHPAIFWAPAPKRSEAYSDLIKRTAEQLGGELLMLKERMHKDREQDLAQEAERQREIEERQAAREAMGDMGHDGDDGHDEDGHDEQNGAEGAGEAEEGAEEGAGEVDEGDDDVLAEALEM